MKQALVTIIILLNIGASFAQDVAQRLTESVKNLEADPLLKHAIISLCVADSKTGKPVFNKNAQVALAPASCQKIFTSIAAFEILGQGYRYKTLLGYDGQIDAGILKGSLHITGTGDPTLGSWRWERTKDSQVLETWITEIKKAGIKKINGLILKDDVNWSSASIPDGWIWQDIGNYYGAGATSVNWRENQYDLTLKSGMKIGDTCMIVSITPASVHLNLVCEVRTAEKGSGDNAFIYLPPGTNFGYVRGTIPIGEKAFTISGSLPEPFSLLSNSFNDLMNSRGIEITRQANRVSMPPVFKVNKLFTYYSPELDSINYWFLKKSINLYGEALLKSIAYEKEGFGSTEKGVELLQNFWRERGIEKSALNIMDGCGLSPQNRVTTDALVRGMLYAKSKSWFSSFYHALPQINGITMKSGSINGARAYTGYIESKSNNEYTFAIIVNNYDGNSSEIIRKLWRVLDILK